MEGIDLKRFQGIEIWSVNYKWYTNESDDNLWDRYIQNPIKYLSFAKIVNDLKSLAILSKRSILGV